MRSLIEGLSDRVKAWLLLGALVFSSFAAGAAFVGWSEIPQKVRGNQVSIGILAQNQINLASQLAVTRCIAMDLGNKECERLRREIQRIIKDPNIPIASIRHDKGSPQ